MFYFVTMTRYIRGNIVEDELMLVVVWEGLCWGFVFERCFSQWRLIIIPNTRALAEYVC